MPHLRLLLLVFCLPLLPAVLFADAALMAHLEKYVGRWQGEFTIKSSVSDYSETFPVEQQYWFEGNHLCGVSVSLREGKGLVSVQSEVYIEKSVLYLKVKRGDAVEQFVGVLKGDALVWLPGDMQRAEDQQTTERILEKNGKWVLRSEGFDTYVYGGGIAYIAIVGELVKGKDG